MSMTRQLLLVILVLFLAMFAGTFSISVNNVRNFLNEQLQTHAQDTATSLGLSLSPHMAGRDLATMGRMIDAINDSGYYKTIELESIDGELLIERHNNVQFREVPAWFVNYVPLETPVASAVVMAGWKQAGWVHVSSHPGYAYAELWRNTVQTFQFFVISSLTALLLGLLALRYILRPLHAMEEQADAICRQQYTVQKNVPRARELRRAVEAMNRMVLKTQETFRDHAALADKLRQQAYSDSVTGLGSRRYFDEQLKQLISSDEEFHHGGVLLIELHDLAGYNQRHGYEAGDRLLKAAATIFRDCSDHRKELLIARISGADFSILAPNTGNDELAALATRLSHSLLELHTSGLADCDEIAHIGVASSLPGDTADRLLSRADMALRQSQTRGPNSWSQLAEDSTGNARNASDWQRLLEKTIQDRNIQLATQPVTDTRGGTGILHQEVLLRIPADDGSLLPAGAFIPMAEQFGLARELDKLAISTLMQQVSADSDMVYAVNISCGSLHDNAFLDWLYKNMELNTAIARRLVFEFPEFAVVSNLEAAKTATSRLHELGCRCSIDHFGRGFTSFSYLCSLKLHCVKIDGFYIRNIQDNPDNRFFVQALTRTLHGIDIQVIAENVESEPERSALSELQIDGIQGHLTGKPSVLLPGS